MSSRYYNDFISAYMQYTEDTEPPRSYHTWISLSLIAAALQRRVYIKWGLETIYPNMYIVLVGPSGKCRKGTAMNIAKDLLQDLSGINTTSESVTREALIRRMYEAIGNYTDPTTRDIKFHCALTTFSPELSVFLGQNDVKFLADLTDWYDSNDEWTYETKGAGTDKIQGLCFNLLGATAPDWFSSILPQEAIGGGFTSRIIFVVEENKGKTIPKPSLTEEMKKARVRLFHDLEQIATISGQYNLDDEAESIYTEWYKDEDKKMAKGDLAIEDQRFAGYCDRRATHVRKISMLISASQRNDLIIAGKDMERAIATLINVEKKMHKAFSGLGQAPYSESTERVIGYIASRGTVTRSDLMNRFYRDVDSSTLKAIEEVMEYMKVVKVIRDLDNQETIYKYIGK